MSAQANLIFPENEQTILSKQERLFHDWKEYMEVHLRSSKGYSAEDFVSDGFYPYYFSQPIRVLFVGRESLGLSGHNYIEVLHKSYRYEKSVGDRHVNQYAFHRRMLYVAYSLNNDFCCWSDIPYADKICDTFGEAGGLSFAIMNLSKFSNESKSWQADHELIKSSVDASIGQRNFIKEQIELLSPNVVVSMNLSLDHLKLMGEPEYLEKRGSVDFYRLVLPSGPALLANTYHFSAIMRETDHYIDPLRSAASDYKSWFLK